MKKNVVKIVTDGGNKWCSGVLLRGAHKNFFVLTNRHAFLKGDNSVTLQFNGYKTEGKIFKVSSNWDLCLLSVPSTNDLKNDADGVHLDQSVAYAIGDVVCVVAYPLFASDPEPTVSQGRITKISYSAYTKVATQIQADALVYSGSSGGIVVNTRGEFLGMITSNMKNVTSQRVIPFVNYALPLAIMKPIVAFLKSGDESHLEQL